MRIARQDKRFNAEVAILLHPLCHRRRIAHQRGTSASAYEAHTRPEIGTDFQIFAASSMQLRHTALTFGIEARKRFLGASDGVIVNVANEVLGSVPGFLLCFSYDDVQANAEPDVATLF